MNINNCVPSVTIKKTTKIVFYNKTIRTFLKIQGTGSILLIGGDDLSWEIIGEKQRYRRVQEPAVSITALLVKARQAVDTHTHAHAHAHLATR